MNQIKESSDIDIESNKPMILEPICQSINRFSPCGAGGITSITLPESNAPSDIILDSNQPISRSSSRSSSRAEGGNQIITTAEIHALFDGTIVNSNQPERIEPISESFSRNLTPTSTSSAISLICEKENNEEIVAQRLTGRRLIDVAYLFEQLSEIDHSPFSCSFKYFKFVSEIRRGFYSSFKFICKMCGVKVVIKSDRPEHELNQHVVQGIVTSGNGFAQLDEFCAHVDIPCMSDKLFIKEHNVFGSMIKDFALEIMYQAGVEEKKIAIAKGNIDPDGIPYITVVVDGSWAKRSYRTNYNSLSGVACIIGFETKKVLFLGIRNAYCCVCAVAKNKNINCDQSVCQRQEIAIKTIGQGANEEWHKQRKIRLTASFFGQVCKLKPTTSCKNVVKQLLYSTFKGNYATKYGHENEPMALKDTEILLGLHIEASGFFICEKHPFLGASPDGLIGDDGIVEIKCPAGAANFTPVEAIDKKKITFCTNDPINKIKLKRNHNFYYQIQGQLQITNRKYCIFIVWTPKGLSHERIEKDDEFWNSIVLKLEEFYFKCILPELIDPRLPRNLPIREKDDKTFINSLI